MAPASGLAPGAFFAGADCSLELLYAPHSRFDLYGSFVPSFCGGLSLGSWRDLPGLARAARAGGLPAVVQRLAAGGPYALSRWAIGEGLYALRPEGYAGKCHLCVDVRRRLAQTGAFPELAPVEFYARF